MFRFLILCSLLVRSASVTSRNRCSTQKDACNGSSNSAILSKIFLFNSAVFSACSNSFS
ncbi:hypothetical protein LINPERPRIM_LOCUS44957 [Linum perenne]